MTGPLAATAPWNNRAVQTYSIDQAKALINENTIKPTAPARTTGNRP